MADAPSSENLIPAEKAAAAKAAKAAAAKKDAPESRPFVDNGDGTVTDPNTGLIWKRKDAWLDTQKFYTWQAHREYVDQVNKEKFAGYDNWRIPSKKEAITLVDKTGTKQCEDKNGTMFPIDPLFEAGCVSNTWISECSDEKIIRFDLKIGVDTPYPGQDIWGSIRLVSKPGEAAASIGGPPKAESTPAKSDPSAADKAEAPAASAAPKPKSGSGGGPRPVKRKLTDEDKAVLRARAKAWAAEKKK
ncbi:hypothetical protein UR09_06525 [Candidatus Nitromaritima sp. SCGC AAA799-A02]|nr:hypothetical protein UR09_06525 [Candidatus Nitromaritima sp. SCGC AAA799-A02]